ncbi:M56 family metallopeptidase [Shewanella pneumatophori]|uniref:Protein TonB n=1 Tax=Shewanella pneumatophori TaxID=314092 RepID=A0A9X2CGZ2_9GAMM|nr:M56 family metallopeptidase [Shewanella pneumatophori]MCL1137929.1 M56 family metallopeptidase [Shewanella pneumatophori]
MAKGKQVMMLWMAQQTLLLSLICVGLLICHKPLQKYLGSHQTYHLWLAVPILLLSSAIIAAMPNLFAAVQSQQIAHYSVLASKVIQAKNTTNYVLFVSYVWLGGIAIMLMLLVLQLVSIKALARSATKVSNPFSRLATYVHPKVQSPMLIGIVNPKIILPVNFNQLNAQEQQAIISHEQYHHQRGDLQCNLLAYGVLCLFWFNPICWLAYRRFRDDQELACDAYVTQSLNKQQKISYSQVLLAYSQQAQHGLLHTHYGNKNILKERIMQMKTQQKGQSSIAVIGLIMVLGLCGLMLNQQVQAGGVDKQSVVYPTVRIEPKYPAEAIEANQNGFVQLKFDITPSGAVTNVSVIKSSPEKVFDAVAITALKQWQYQSSVKGVQGSKVQLDFEIEAPATDVERIKVTSK